ncbi:MAG: hypothetical protein IPM45_07875 [Acidimicrobiales bacterium]|nr:hypothetical protein [Acidimicrobiales bacterium]
MSTTPIEEGTVTLTADNLRGVPHAEVIIFTEDADGPGASSVFYNSLGLPQELSGDDFDAHFRALDPEALKAEFHGDGVWMNGPRRSMMDTATVEFLESGKITPIGDIPMRTGGRVHVADLAGLLGKRPAYSELRVERTTEWVFLAGRQVYELVSPSGSLYVLQSLSRAVDPNLDVEQLPTLGDRMQLPDGWEYRVRTLDDDLIVRASGDAHIVFDEYESNYQRLDR